MLIARLCLHEFHSWLSRAWPVPRVIVPHMTIPRVTIPHVAQDELHERFIFHAMRKRGPHSHVTELFKYLLCCHTCKMKL